MSLLKKSKRKPVNMYVASLNKNTRYQRLLIDASSQLKNVRQLIRARVPQDDPNLDQWKFTQINSRNRGLPVLVTGPPIPETREMPAIRCTKNNQSIPFAFLSSRQSLTLTCRISRSRRSLNTNTGIATCITLCCCCYATMLHTTTAATAVDCQSLELSSLFLLPLS